jgi:KDEL-tailed cysteine endopeptidase
MNKPKPVHNANTPFRYSSVVAAPTVDWRGTAVTPVKDQGQCGSCWAFSATGTIEGAWYLATGDLVSIAEQELVDCDVGIDAGCNGGLMDYAMDYVINNGICAEEAYPYTARDETCKKDQCAAVVTLNSHESVPSSNEAALKQAVTMRPVAVAAQADELAFQLYSGGVFDGQCGTQLDHGMLAVGYGFDDASGLEYWIIKNSWGAGWGDNGYINMAFGMNDGDCQCGICLEASYGVSDGHPAGPAPPVAPKNPPPPGGGDLIACDDQEAALCAADETCCCVETVGTECLAFGCCPYPQAVCCDDYSSCCPSGYTCDVADQTCLMSATESVPMKKPHAAIAGPGAKGKVPGFIKN